MKGRRILFFLLLLSAGIITNSSAQVVSTFDNGDEGWRLDNNASGKVPIYYPSNGNPGGYLSSLDLEGNLMRHWVAPPKFLGNQYTTGCPKLLQFDLRQNRTDYQVDSPDVLIYGSGITIICRLPKNPDIIWTHYSIPVDASYTWLLNSFTGNRANQSTINTVLSNITSLRIRGEFCLKTDVGDIDNVWFGSDYYRRTIDTALCQGEEILHHNETGDYIDTLTGVSCDSIISIHLRVYKKTDTTITRMVCKGAAVNGHTTNGNYIDTYINAGGCDSTIRLHLTVTEPVMQSIDSTVCEGTTVFGYDKTGMYTDTLQSRVTGCDSLRILNLSIKPIKRSFFDTTICYGHSYLQHAYTGTFATTYAGSNGCDSISTLHLTVLPQLMPDLGKDSIICTGKTREISPGTFSRYRWQDNSAGASYMARQSGLYTVTVFNGCDSATASIRLVVRPCIIRFPTGFSPNGDGRNDLFRVVNGEEITRYSLMIYTRYGEKVFETHTVGEGWNGMVNDIPLATGTYVYECIYKTSANEPEQEQYGTFVLLR